MLANLPEDEQPRFAAWRDRLLAGESAPSIQLRVPRGDGPTRQIEAHGRFRSAPGGKGAMVVVIADVTTLYLLRELAEELEGCVLLTSWSRRPSRRRYWAAGSTTA